MANATKYVDNVNGNNANTGNSEAQAYADIATAFGAISGGGNIVYVQAGSNYSIGTALSLPSAGDTTNGRNRIEGYTTTPGTRDGKPTITSATNSCNLIEIANRSYWDVVHLNLTHTAGTRGVGINSGVSSAPINLLIDDVIIDGCSYGFLDAGYTHAGLTFRFVEIKNSVNDGIMLQSGSDCLCYGCKLNTNGRDGFRSSYNVSAQYRFERTELRANTGRGVYMTTTSGPVLVKFCGCTVRGNGSSGYEDASTSAGSTRIHLADNVWYSNGAYGIKLAITAAEAKCVVTSNVNNAFGSNTSGNLSICPSGYNEIALSGNPFASSTDSTPANNAYGAQLKNAGLGGFDIGALQHADSGGGAAGMLFVPNLDGV